MQQVRADAACTHILAAPLRPAVSRRQFRRFCILEAEIRHFCPLQLQGASSVALQEESRRRRRAELKVRITCSCVICFQCCSAFLPCRRHMNWSQQQAAEALHLQLCSFGAGCSEQHC